MTKEIDFDLSDASSAAHRLSPEADSALLEELRGQIRLLNEQIPEDRLLDPVTQLRSSLDYTEMLAGSAGGTRSLSERVKELLEELIPTKPGDGDNLLRGMQGAVATGIASAFSVLEAAIDQNQVEFMFNNPSAVWRDIEASQTLFRAVLQAKRLLNELAQATQVGKNNLNDADELIEALQDEIIRQLSNSLEIKRQARTRRARRTDEIKKIGGQLLGPPSDLTKSSL